MTDDRSPSDGGNGTSDRATDRDVSSRRGFLQSAGTAAVFGGLGTGTAAAQSAESPPISPENTRATEATPTSLSLAWDLGPFGTEIDHFEVEVNWDDVTWTATTTEQSIEMGRPPIDADTEYEVWVNSVGTNGARAPDLAYVTTPAADAEAPAAPSDLAVGATDRESADLQFTGPDADVDHYEVHYAPLEDGTVSGEVRSQATASTETSISDLEPAQRYYAWIWAVDASGRASPAATTRFATRGDLTAPVEPGPVDVAATGADALAVSWDRPVDVGGAGLDHFEVSWEPTEADDGTAGSHTLAADETETTIDGLTAGRRYAVEVVAVDGAGNRSRSVSTTPTMTESVAESALLERYAARTVDAAGGHADDVVEVSIEDDGRVRLLEHASIADPCHELFVHDVAFDGSRLAVVLENRSVDNYCTPVDAGAVVEYEATFDLDQRPTEIGVRTRDVDDLHVIWEADGEVAPARPRDLEVTRVADTWATVEWDHPPAVTGAETDHYEVTLEGESIGPVSSGRTWTTVTGLEPDYYHDLEVAAVDADGDASPTAETQITTTPQGERLVTDLTAVETGASAVTLTWSTASAEDRPWKPEELQLVSNGERIARVDPDVERAEITGLDPGTLYEFRVFADGGYQTASPGDRVRVVTDDESDGPAVDVAFRDSDGSLTDAVTFQRGSREPRAASVGVLDATERVGEFEVVVSLGRTDVAEIVNASLTVADYPGWVEVAPDGSTARFRFDDAPGDGHGALGEIYVEPSPQAPDEQVETSLDVDVRRLTDEDGAALTPSEGSSTVTVRPGGATATPTPDGPTDTPTPTPEGPTATPTPSNGTARDLNGDGLFEDVNGNGESDFGDVTELFERMDSIDDETKFDFNANGELDFGDVVALFERQ